MSEHDVVVVGAGAAGLSAALVLLRARRSVVLVDAGAPRNAPAARVHGFLSRDGTPPGDLIAAGRAEVVAYGGRLVADTVLGIEPGFTVHLGSGPALRARRILVATGLRDVLPDVPGVRERWGRDLLHCPYCHGYEVRDQPLGVLGGGPEAVQHALLVRQWSADVTFFPHTGALTGEQRGQLTARGVRIVEGAVARLVVRDDHLQGVELADGAVVPRSAVFVRPQFLPNTDLLGTLGCAVDTNGWVVTDTSGRTSVPGVWLAGNAADPRAQVITAAGQGSAAAIALNADLVADDVARAVTFSAVPPTRPTEELTAMSQPVSQPVSRATPVPPPTRHQLALMIWVAVFPTLTVLNLLLGGRLDGLSTVLRTFVLATIAVPIVIYGLMPHLHRARAALVRRRRTA